MKYSSQASVHSAVRIGFLPVSKPFSEVLSHSISSVVQQLKQECTFMLKAVTRAAELTIAKAALVRMKDNPKLFVQPTGSLSAARIGCSLIIIYASMSSLLVA